MGKWTQLFGHAAATLFVLLMLSTASSAQSNPPRIALVIGNSNYNNAGIPNLTRLPSAVNDAQDIRDALRRSNFEVIFVDNAGHERLHSAIVEFGQRLAARPDAVALFYFSGHGVQLDRRSGPATNVLLPVDLTMATDTEIERRGLSLDTVLSEMSKSRAQPKIVILDACRTPGFGKNIGGKGLARVSTSGFLIAYASEPGTPSFDDFTRGERNSRYTKHLLSQLRQPGQRLDEVFVNTRRLLEADPLNRENQASEETNRLTLPEPFYFITGNSLPQTTAPNPAPAATTSVQVRPAAPAANPSAEGVGFDFMRTAPPATLEANSSARRITANPVPQSAPIGDLRTFKDCEECPEMVVIPSGRFIMGSPDTEPGRSNSESPQRQVIIQRFAMGRYEVTQGQWKSIMGSNPSYHQGFFSKCKDDCPVEQVTWEEIQLFIQRLNQRTSQNYRLPSEAEWEYAARAGSQTMYPFGTDQSQLGVYAWIYANHRGSNQPVGKKQANLWGLHDMLGNVNERVQDCWHDNYNNAPTDGSAWTSECDESKRVVRGGSWGQAQDLRSASRQWGLAHYRGNGGFRLARTTP